VRVQAWNEPLQAMRVDAEVMAPGVVRLDTENVASLSLSPPREHIGSSQTLRVIWNGAERIVPINAGGEAQLTSATSLAADRKQLIKRPELAGALSGFFTTPFVIVIGTSSKDADMRRICQAKADTFAQIWNTWQHTMPRILRDDQVTPEIERQYSLLLIGGPDANRVSKRMAARVPLQVQKDAVTVQGRRFAATDAVAQIIYPNPSQPNRYVLMVAGTSAAGLYFWNTAAYIHPVFGFPSQPLDWVINDGRRVAVEKGLGSERAWIASGVFDMRWQRTDRWTFLGDEKLRARSALRHAPASGFTVLASTLDAYAGVYEIRPGVSAVVTRDEHGLTAIVNGGAPMPLIAETEAEFNAPTIGGSLVFERGGDGRVSQFVVTMGESATVAKKVR
jgi:hypothetical protein